MLHALSATFGTLAIIASIKAKLDYAKQMRSRATGAAQSPGQPSSQGVR